MYRSLAQKGASFGSEMSTDVNKALQFQQKQLQCRKQDDFKFKIMIPLTTLVGENVSNAEQQRQKSRNKYIAYH